ncbi:MAG: hypothetical protein GY944_15260 [bacterium]|nr:hypothetical protein [bacterium]
MMREHHKESRLPAFVGGPSDSAAVLAAASVALVGVGSVGLAAASHFARIGIGRILLFDRSSLKAASVLTHPLLPADVAATPAKVDHARRVIHQIAPDTAVEVFGGDFAAQPLDALDVGVVLLAVDNLSTELEVTERCLNLGLPLIQAAVHGPTLSAVVRTYTGGHAGEGPCIGCQYDATEWEQVTREATFSCDGRNAERGRSLAPTRSPSSLCSLAGELAVHRVMRHFLGLGTPLSDQLLEYHGYLEKIVTTELRRNVDCPLAHERYQFAARSGVSTVAAATARSGLLVPHTIAVDGMTFVSKAVCESGHWHSIDRFVPQDFSGLAPCDACDARLLPSPFHQTAAVAVKAHLDLALPPHRALLVRDCDGRAVLLSDRLTKRSST